MIESPANPTIKGLVRLRTRRARNTTGRFLIEGRREIERAHIAGVVIEELFVSTSLPDDEFVHLVASTGTPVTLTSEVAFAKASARSNPDGLLAVAEQFDVSLERLEPAANPLLLVVEAVEKPGNLGAMLRSADGAGADAVIVADPTTDVFNPNVVRASQGALFFVDVAVAPAASVRTWLESNDISVVTADPTAATPPWEADLRGPTALVVGAEHAGLSVGWEGTAVSLPMRGRSDSLNAAAAATALLYEAVRQRSDSR